MVRVCEDIFQKGFSHNIHDGFYIDGFLKEQLDILIKNIKNDWDFTIIITGSGEVRVGKSVLAMQIGAYWTDQIYKKYKIKVPFTLRNFVFDGLSLIRKGNELGTKYKYSSLIYDEAGADLSSKKIMNRITSNVLDYLRECGQYNMLNILVLPDYFELPRPVAITRSIFLLNVDYVADKEGIFQRGYFNFYSRRSKLKLYLYGKKELNYKAYHYEFRGRFYNFYPINEEEYRKKKKEALRVREEKDNDKDSRVSNKEMLKNVERKYFFMSLLVYIKAFSWKTLDTLHREKFGTLLDKKEFSRRHKINSKWIEEKLIKEGLVPIKVTNPSG